MTHKITITSTLKWIAFVLMLLAVSYLLFNKKDSSDIAFVNSQKVLWQYEGMKEVQQKHQLKIDAWQAHIDSLELSYEQGVQEYNRQRDNMDQAQRDELEAKLSREGMELDKYSNSIEQKAQEENEKVMQGVLNQINSYVKNYGEEHGYEIIFGITQSGSILYGNEEKDITEQIIIGLNRQFAGK